MNNQMNDLFLENSRPGASIKDNNGTQGLTLTSIKTQNWKGLPASFNGSDIWTDGKNIYASNDCNYGHLKLEDNEWQTVDCDISFSGYKVWNYKTNTYFPPTKYWRKSKEMIKYIYELFCWRASSSFFLCFFQTFCAGTEINTSSFCFACKIQSYSIFISCNSYELIFRF